MRARRPANLYKDAERLIEDFFANYDLRISPKAGCDEVAVQRVKETLQEYLEATREGDSELCGSEVELVFRAALTDFLYEVYFTLDDDMAAGPLGARIAAGTDWSDEEAAFALDALSDELDEDLDDGVDDEDVAEAELYSVLALPELCELLRGDPEEHVACQCLAEKGLAYARAVGSRAAEAELERTSDALRSRKPTPDLRKVLADVHFALGELHRAAQDDARAIAAYKQAVRTSGHLPEAYGHMAHAHLRMADGQAALEAWRDQIALCADDPRPYFASAELLERGGRRDRAIETLSALVRIDPENATALDKLVRLCHETDRVPEAQTWRERLLAMDPPTLQEDLAVWVKHHVDAGDHDRVLEHLHREELEQPLRPLYNLLKAAVFQAKEDPDNVEVELLLVRDKIARSGDRIADLLMALERGLGTPRVDALRRAADEGGA